VCAQHAARHGVKNRLLPRELAASVLPAFGSLRQEIHIAMAFVFNE
jgi:hypothetical protein